MENTTRNPRPIPPTLSARQLGKLFAGLSPSEVRELVETTDIPHRRVKGHLRFDLAEIKMWLDRNVVPFNGAPLSLDELVALYGDD